MNILIVFATKEGQTEKIANFVAESINRNGHQATTLLCKKVLKNVNTDAFDGVIIGGPIHVGGHPRCLKKFVTSHRDWLNRVPSAFFTVCMAINSKNEKDRASAKSYGQKFIQDTNWQPFLVETIAGAVKYTQYDFITRFIMRNIGKKEGRDTDTSRDYEYTDWNKVKQFAEQFITEAGK